MIENELDKQNFEYQIKEITHLQDLLNKGIITRKEFEAKKKKILGI